MQKAMMVTLSALTMIIAMSNARAAMPIDARKTAYFVGKAASQLPPGYITEEFLRKLAAATGCDTPFWVEDFIQTERDQEQYFRIKNSHPHEQLPGSVWTQAYLPAHHRF